MALEPPLTAAAQAKLKQTREQIDAALDDLVGDMLALATAERDTAISDAKTQAAGAIEKARGDHEAEIEAQAAKTVAEAEERAAQTVAAERAEAERRFADIEKRLAEAEESAAQAVGAERADAERRVADVEKRLAEAKQRAAEAVAAERREADRRVAEAETQAAERLADTRAEERQSDLACLERLLDAIRDIDTATSLSQVLDKLADRAAAHIARVAVLIVRPSTGSLRPGSGTPSNVEGSGRGERVEPRDHQLRGWRTIGFDETAADPSAITVSLDAPTVVGRAVDTSARATTANGAPGAPLEPLPFATLPADRIGVALPLTVGVRTVAVLYADEGMAAEPPVPSAWPEALEILARHAACRLELLTLGRAYGLHAQPFDSPSGGPLAQGRPFDSPSGGPLAQGRPFDSPSVGPLAQGKPFDSPSGGPLAQGKQGASANGGARASGEAWSGTDAAPLTAPGSRASSVATDAAIEIDARAQLARQISEEDASALRYARLLISEIKLYHEDAVNDGRRDANLLARLGSEIARARRLYEERVPAEVRSRADHFGQELVRTLANGDPTLLGRDT